MNANPKSIDLPAWAAEHLKRAEPDLLRSILHTFVQALMSAEADAVCGTELPAAGVGHSGRHFRSGDPQAEVPTYFPDWLLEHRKRAEKAMVSVVATCYLLGVSTAGWRSWSSSSASPGSRSHRCR